MIIVVALRRDLKEEHTYERKFEPNTLIIEPNTLVDMKNVSDDRSAKTR